MMLDVPPTHVNHMNVDAYISLGRYSGTVLLVFVDDDTLFIR